MADQPWWFPDFTVVTDGTDSLLVRPVIGELDGFGYLEAVPFNDTVIGAPFRSDADPGTLSNVRNVLGLRAALDGDVVVVLYNTEPIDLPDLPAVAELSFPEGELLEPPRYLGGHCLAPGEIVSHPGGGVDIVRQSVGCSADYDYRLNTPHPLEVYLGRRPPISLHDATPLRVGAGAYAHSFRVARDGDRLIVVWAETGPSTLRDRDTGMRRTVEGLFYAVLRCDGT